MKEYSVTVFVHIDVSTVFQVKAESEKSAEEKVTGMIEAGKLDLKWGPTDSTDPNLEWEEQANIADVDTVEES